MSEILGRWSSDYFLRMCLRTWWWFWKLFRKYRSNVIVGIFISAIIYWLVYVIFTGILLSNMVLLLLFLLTSRWWFLSSARNTVRTRKLINWYKMFLNLFNNYIEASCGLFKKYNDLEKNEIRTLWVDTFNVKEFLKYSKLL